VLNPSNLTSSSILHSPSAQIYWLREDFMGDKAATVWCSWGSGVLALSPCTTRPNPL
jgi:hypothetical protein